MNNYKNRRIILIILIIFIVVLILLVVFAIIRGDLWSFKDGINSVDISRQELIKTSDDRAVSMIVRGEIVADEDFKSYRIYITPNQRDVMIYKGYMKELTKSASFNNNVPAYEQFVYALDRAGLMNNSELTGDNNDVRGVCATGNLYEFELVKSNKVIKKLWSSSCSNSRGSLGAGFTKFTRLFLVQVPSDSSIGDNLWQ